MEQGRGVRSCVIVRQEKSLLLWRFETLLFCYPFSKFGFGTAKAVPDPLSLPSGGDVSQKRQHAATGLATGTSRAWLLSIPIFVAWGLIPS